MNRYIIVSASSLPNDKDDDEEIDTAALDILSHEGQPLLFDHRIDAEDFMDKADVDVEMVIINAPESLTGIIVA